MSAISEPLLTSTEINRLMATNARKGKVASPNSNQLSQFGDQPSSVIGTGTDFADRRPYIVGDDPRFIDWRASARSSQMLVRSYHTEISVPACIVIDRRASMRFGTRKCLKVTQAVRAAIQLGTQLIKSHFQLATLVLDQPGYWQSPQTSLAALRSTALIAAKACPPIEPNKTELSWSRVSDCLRHRLAKTSRLILISDFMSLDPTRLKSLKHLGHHFDLSLIQIHDASEQAAESLTNIDLCWGEMSITMGTDSRAPKKLNQQIDRHRQQQAEWFNNMGKRFIQLAAHEPLNKLDRFL